MTKKILIVDDEKPLANMLASHLREEGYETMTANNGQEALEKIKESVPNLILLDILMPVMDGVAFLEKLRLEASFRQMPVIMMTNKEEKDDFKKANDLGVSFYFIKSNTSLKVLDEWIKQLVQES